MLCRQQSRCLEQVRNLSPRAEVNDRESEMSDSISQRMLVWMLRSVIGTGMLLLASSAAFAAGIDCRAKVAGGQTECQGPVPKMSKSVDSDGYGSNICDQLTDFVGKSSAQCAAIGGTWNGLYGNPQCVGGTNPVTKSEFVSFEERYLNIYFNCPGAHASLSWGQTINSYVCWTGSPGYQNGVLVKDFAAGIATFVSRDTSGNCTVPGSTNVFGATGMSLVCPAGWRARAKTGGPARDIECYQLPSPRDLCMANPVDIATCGKIEREVDIRQSMADGLEFVRTFRSNGYLQQAAGIPPTTWDVWYHTYSRRILLPNDSPLLLGIAQRENGDMRSFGLDGKELMNLSSGPSRLEKLTDGAGNLSGWRYTAADLAVELYNATGQLTQMMSRRGLNQFMTYSDAATPPAIAPGSGLLITITDDFGRMIRLTYDAQKRLSTATGIVSAATPVGDVYAYSYDVAGNLSQVTMPDAKTRTYVYERTDLPRLLTGIIDENNVRFSTFAYDTEGFATNSKHVGDVYQYAFTHQDDSYGNRSVSITDPLGVVYTYRYELRGGALRPYNIRRQCATCGDSNSATVNDSNGNVTSRTDFRGYKTTYTFDMTRNLETRRVEALLSDGSSTSATRTISTEWHPMYRFPTRIAEPLRLTTLTYDAAGNLLTKRLQSTTDANGSLAFAATTQGTPRSWTYTYTPTFGRVLTVDGPRTDVVDVTTYAYYADNDGCAGCRGQVRTLSNALNHVTTYDSYDANGRVTQITDANGVVTTMTYHPRGWLNSRTVNAGQPSAETTTVRNIQHSRCPSAVLASESGLRPGLFEIAAR